MKNRQLQKNQFQKRFSNLLCILYAILRFQIILNILFVGIHMYVLSQNRFIIHDSTFTSTGFRHWYGSIVFKLKNIHPTLNIYFVMRKSGGCNLTIRSDVPYNI